ncbi:MAG: Site-specific recombinase XerD [Anaerolineae bacterium]|nr:MAG: Site-specific recombinase XerD [Anaerolineae bacterium]
MGLCVCWQNLIIGSGICQIKNLSPASQNLHLSAVKGLYKFLLAERISSPRLPRIEQLIAERARKAGRRRPQFPRADIERLIEYAQYLIHAPLPDENETAGAGGKTSKPGGLYAERRRMRLRNLRDRTFILLLANSGLRVSEACQLRIEDVDFLEARLRGVGKGDQEDWVRVSERVLNALQDYLNERQPAADHAATPHRRRPAALEQRSPLFVRHDRRARFVPPSGLDPSTAWDIVHNRAAEARGSEAAQSIHPHAFRHYFLTIVLVATNNMEKARRLARHRSIITTTQRYAEVDSELDRDDHEIINKKAA